MDSKEQPKILIGCPTGNFKEYCLEEYLEGIKKFTYKNYDLVLIDNSKEDKYYKKLKSKKINVIKYPCIPNIRTRIANSREILRKYALDNNYDYFLSLEQDIIAPVDLIERLLSHKKKVVCGVYNKLMKITDEGQFLREEEMPLIWIIYEGKLRRFFTKDLPENYLIPITASGLGCVLIHRSILEKIEFRSEENNKNFDDLFFYQDLINNLKIQAFCDTTIKCQHLEKEWTSEIKNS